MSGIFSQPTAGQPQPLYSVYASYDVTTLRPERDVAQLFRDAAVSLSAELDTLRDEHSTAKVTLATAEERARSLHRQLQTRRHIQLVLAGVSALGAVLVGFGVNYLTSDKSSAPGWVMLILGVVMELVAIAAPLLDREPGGID